MAQRGDLGIRRGFGDFVLDPVAREIWHGGERLRLQPHVFQVLELLTARPGEVVTRDEIVKLLWPSRVVDFEAGLNSVIRRLRTVLEDDAEAPRFVETLPRHGYRFIAAVESLPASAEENAVPGVIVGTSDGVPAGPEGVTSAPRPTVSLPRIPPIHVFWAITVLLVVSSFATFATLRTKPDEKPPKAPDAQTAAIERSHTLAWKAYQRGRYLTFKHHRAEAHSAIVEFNRALELDPNLAEAWSGLAGVYVSMAMFPERNPREMEQKARDAIARAMALNPDLPDVHVVNGRIAYVFDWNWEAAEASYRRALELDPENTGALLWWGMLDGSLGRADVAVRRLERAAELDPASLQIGGFLCKTYVLARQYDHAVEQCHQDLVLESTQQLSTDWLAYAYEMRGEDQKAVQTYLDFAHAVRDPEFAEEIERVGGKQGIRALRAKWARDELEAAASDSIEAAISPARRAWLQLWLGDTRGVGPLLQQAYDQRDFFLVWFATKPETAALADDPTYRALRARMGLPPFSPTPEAVAWVKRFAAPAG